MREPTHLLCKHSQSIIHLSLDYYHCEDVSSTLYCVERRHMWSSSGSSLIVTCIWLKVPSLYWATGQCLHCQEAYSKENTQRELRKVCTVQTSKVGHLSREEKGWGERGWICAVAVFLSAQREPIMALESLPVTALELKPTVQGYVRQWEFRSQYAWVVV